MRIEIQEYLDSRPEEKLFVRMHPEWYRKLSRSPWELSHLKSAANQFYGRTFSQRLDRFNQRASMMSMLVSMAQAMSAQKSKD
ncbi:YlbE-like family protein [Sporolactobacillus shoreicorticis]|uniref:YlbE-like family protein n=1 Tax=Sporolactobacillus shoreicorticis TaxID=1923877 RepID=A0ABW5S625_9BACL|nr:YlbE-like family protein [Sporolactobacillus shoreicorticis]MCO7126279.1 YlbE-like family protein [Sporolactobacillus shoreicorticis]